MLLAALLDADGQAVTPATGGTVHVFEDVDGFWTVGRTLEFEPIGNHSMDDLRHRVEQLCEWLGECTVLAAGVTNGYYRVTFASFGVTLWPVRGTPEQFIDLIAGAYRQAATQPAEVVEEEPPIKVVELPHRAGHFRVDLRNAMGKPGAHTSKEVLLPFLAETNFRQLEVLCDHVPKWFARVLPEYQLTSKEQTRDDYVHVVIYPLKGRAISSRPQFDFKDLTCYTALS
jgi:Fe-only nitrogenase accessory protein AnfO